MDNKLLIPPLNSKLPIKWSSSQLVLVHILTVVVAPAGCSSTALSRLCWASLSCCLSAPTSWSSSLWSRPDCARTNTSCVSGPDLWPRLPWQISNTHLLFKAQTVCVCVCTCSAERLVGVVHLPAGGATQIGGSGDSWSGRRHHHTGSAVVSAAVAPVVLPYLPE